MSGFRIAATVASTVNLRLSIKEIDYQCGWEGSNEPLTCFRGTQDSVKSIAEKWQTSLFILKFSISIYLPLCRSNADGTLSVLQKFNFKQDE